VEEEQITREIQLEEDLKVEEGLNIFKSDPNYLEDEESSTMGQNQRRAIARVMTKPFPKGGC